jgi:hypothetical protein
LVEGGELGSEDPDDEAFLILLEEKNGVTLVISFSMKRAIGGSVLIAGGEIGTHSGENLGASEDEGVAIQRNGGLDDEFPVDPKPDPDVIPFRFEMDVARPPFNGVLKEVIQKIPFDSILRPIDLPRLDDGRRELRGLG